MVLNSILRPSSLNWCPASTRRVAPSAAPTRLGFYAPRTRHGTKRPVILQIGDRERDVVWGVRALMIVRFSSGHAWQTPTRAKDSAGFRAWTHACDSPGHEQLS